LEYYRFSIVRFAQAAAFAYFKFAPEESPVHTAKGASKMAHHKTRSCSGKPRYTIGLLLDNIYESYGVKLWSGVVSGALGDDANLLCFVGGSLDSPYETLASLISSALKGAKIEFGRKHLEQEITEISRKEQMRIGQDLHDGICQSLTGIAFMCKVLRDQLSYLRNKNSEEKEYDI